MQFFVLRLFIALKKNWYQKIHFFPKNKMLDDWIYIFLPRISCALAWVVNPIFVYFIFTEKSQTFGNYRYLLLFFALFNLLYSVVNVVVPIVSFKKVQ